MHVSWKH